MRSKQLMAIVIANALTLCYSMDQNAKAVSQGWGEYLWSFVPFSSSSPQPVVPIIYENGLDHATQEKLKGFVAKNQLEALDRLLEEKKINPNIKIGEKLLWQLAMQHKNTSIVGLLIKKGLPHDQLMEAAKYAVINNKSNTNNLATCPAAMQLMKLCLDNNVSLIDVLKQPIPKSFFYYTLEDDPCVWTAADELVFHSREPMLNIWLNQKNNIASCMLIRKAIFWAKSTTVRHCLQFISLNNMLQEFIPRLLLEKISDKVEALKNQGSAFYINIWRNALQEVKAMSPQSSEWNLMPFYVRVWNKFLGDKEAVKFLLLDWDVSNEKIVFKYSIQSDALSRSR